MQEFAINFINLSNLELNINFDLKSTTLFHHRLTYMNFMSLIQSYELNYSITK